MIKINEIVSIQEQLMSKEELKNLTDDLSNEIRNTILYYYSIFRRIKKYENPLIIKYRDYFLQFLFEITIIQIIEDLNKINDILQDNWAEIGKVGMEWIDHRIDYKLPLDFEYKDSPIKLNKTYTSSLTHEDILEIRKRK